MNAAFDVIGTEREALRVRSIYIEDQKKIHLMNVFLSRASYILILSVLSIIIEQQYYLDIINQMSVNIACSLLRESL